MASRTNTYRGKLSRKSHQKSRLGCGNCKRRRIKCDEVKPSCGPCMRHSTDCDFEVGDSADRNSSSLTPSKEDDQRLTPGGGYTYISSFQTGFKPPKRKHTRRCESSKPNIPSQAAQNLEQVPLSALANRPFEFSALDMELFHTYMSSTSLTLAENEAGRQLLQTQLPRLGFSFNYVLRLLLAFSGFHLARTQKTTNTATYSERAQWHYTVAIGQLISSVTSLNAGTCHAVYAASSFMCFCALARGPQSGDYLTFSSSGQAEWLTLLHGVRSIVETTDQMSIKMSPTPESRTSADAETAGAEAVAPPSLLVQDSNTSRADFLIPLNQIRQAVFNELEHSDFRHGTYLKVYEDLVSTFQSVRNHMRDLSKGERVSFIFGWLYRLPKIFVTDLQEQRPLSLVLFAFFVVLLKDISGYWFIDGWPKHIMTGIYQCLDEGHRPWIQWPAAAIEGAAYTASN
ncbi:hypothetical protein BDV23DRAFT_164916 [Aspergillus alliaceus]|uniref:Zn(2)-C6 fungal-type domain-containing protein n=1 Tax=Petromyces alliaceus TaxID=209559 RepID=A0A5N7BUE0_PETAA|nr:hypothetical protein BDV23DRAFT_164916 [Aspergillus alliaceus]